MQLLGPTGQFTPQPRSVLGSSFRKLVGLQGLPSKSHQEPQSDLEVQKILVRVQSVADRHGGSWQGQLMGVASV